MLRTMLKRLPPWGEDMEQALMAQYRALRRARNDMPPRRVRVRLGAILAICTAAAGVLIWGVGGAFKG